MKSITLFFTLLLAQIMILSQPCPDSLYLTRQTQIDSFQIIYPMCSEIEGNVYILNDDITNLNGLNNLTSIGGMLSISNTTLTNLTGLDGIDSIGGLLFIGSNLSLTSLTGLEGLASVSWYLKIFSNESLASLSGLQGLTSIGGSLVIDGQFGGNSSLTDLTGLESLTSIGGTISILRNSDLNSLSGIENIDPGSIQGLNIHHNPSLSWCAVLSICNYLANPGGMAYIGTSNSYGCQSTEEVLDSCEANSVAIVENELSGESMVSPNPFKGFTTFSYILEKPSKIIITIYNPQGQIIDKIHQGQAKGKQKVQWNSADLPAGMYYYRFQAGNRYYMGKVIAR